MKALKITGSFDSPTKKRAQKWLKVPEDGIFKTQSIKALQKKVKAKVDGIWGKATTKKLQQYLNQYSKAGLKVDGIFGKTSKSALQRYLNKVFKKQIDPDPKPAKTKGDLIAAKAKECAWPYGTKRSVYTYPTGKPVAAFKKAIDQAYPNRSSWGKQTRAGASCDVFSGTCIRASGVDKKFPRGLSEQIPYLKKHTELWKPVKATKLSDLKAGDVFIENSNGHICIYVGGGRICEAGYTSKRYGCTNKCPSRYYNGKAKIYRAK